MTSIYIFFIFSFTYEIFMYVLNMVALVNLIKLGINLVEIDLNFCNNELKDT